MKINIRISVSNNLEIVDTCCGEVINHGGVYDRTIIVSNSVPKSVSLVLSNISILSTTYTKQKLAEHCNNIIRSHCSYILNTDAKDCGIYYPHLQVLIVDV
jgi:hypothetical protein